MSAIDGSETKSGLPQGEQSSNKDAEICPKCKSVDNFDCIYVGDTGVGSEYVDTYRHVCKSCGEEISSPCRTVNPDTGQDPDNYCPSCGRITQKHS